MTGVLRRLAAWGGHRLREVAVLPRALDRRDGPRIAFFPSSSREGASLLRAWNMAGALRPLGWRTLVVPMQLEEVQRRRLMRVFAPDLILFQQCRHPLNDANHAMGLPFVLDCDDADFLDPAIAPRLEATARGAMGVVCGSRFIRDWAAGLNARAEVIWTGTPVSPVPPPDQRTRGAVVAWAQASPAGYPMELAFVQELTRRLWARGLRFRLRLYGVGTAEEAAIRAGFGPGADLELMPLMGYDAFLASLRDVAVGLSPIIAASPFSRGKSFGKILGYLDAGVPVIASDEADHALFFTPESGVVSNDPAVWEAAVARLLGDGDARAAMAGAARAEMERRLSVTAAAARLDAFLRGLRLPK
ncbi:glycosyltransferase family protein [Neotabrizicola shimadae]|uniref:Glycosyltransferase n=1 Tax=Neotabrizicola shimadae TaxID=2807096 RepID=A0A8G0ZYK5_9RHOB|nr:glycosyltransferase [Neotabrizicola shimadae]QYZ70539.1 glycosyltransferase [Neotabrizicola shimadae]